MVLFYVLSKKSVIYIKKTQYVKFNYRIILSMYKFGSKLVQVFKTI